MRNKKPIYNVSKTYLAPGKSGRRVKSSAIIAPTAHISEEKSQ